MATWRDFLRMLREDGVSLDEIDTGEVDEDGHPRKIQCLTRSFSGRLLLYPLPQPINMDDRVGKRQQRQIANVLRLPPEKYVFPDS